MYLKDIWPTHAEVRRRVKPSAITPEQFQQQYANVFTGNETWNAVPVTKSELYAWDEAQHLHPEPAVLRRA